MCLTDNVTLFYKKEMHCHLKSKRKETLINFQIIEVDILHNEHYLTQRKLNKVECITPKSVSLRSIYRMERSKWYIWIYTTLQRGFTLHIFVKKKEDKNERSLVQTPRKKYVIEPANFTMSAVFIQYPRIYM